MADDSQVNSIRVDTKAVDSEGRDTLAERTGIKQSGP
jgi:hypothetical protein